MLLTIVKPYVLVDIYLPPTQAHQRYHNIICNDMNKWHWKYVSWPLHIQLPLIIIYNSIDITIKIDSVLSMCTWGYVSRVYSGYLIVCCDPPPPSLLSTPAVSTLRKTLGSQLLQAVGFLDYYLSDSLQTILFWSILPANCFCCIALSFSWSIAPP